MQTRSLACLLAVVGVLVLFGCSSAANTPPAPVAPRVSAASLRSPIETGSIHASMLEYLATHRSQVVRRLTRHDEFDPDIALSTATAEASHLGTPVPYWDYNASLLPSAGADPWLGVVPSGDRHEYLVPVIATDTPIATLAIWDLPHVWVPFLDWNYSSLAASATPEIEREIGPGFDWGYVHTQGRLWMLARNHGRSAGVLLSFRKERPGTPRGVLTGPELNRWLARPEWP